jgi:hypothetical protein
VSLEPRMYAPLAELIDMAGRLTKNDESVRAIITRVEGEAGSLGTVHRAALRSIAGGAEVLAVGADLFAVITVIFEPVKVSSQSYSLSNAVVVCESRPPSYAGFQYQPSQTWQFKFSDKADLKVVEPYEESDLQKLVRAAVEQMPPERVHRHPDDGP